MEIANVPVIVASDEKSPSLPGVIVESQTAPLKVVVAPVVPTAAPVVPTAAQDALKTTPPQDAALSRAAPKIDAVHAKKFMNRFKSYLANGAFYAYPGTDGSYPSNLKAYVSQEHTLLSLFYANRVHPFSRKERTLFLFNSITWLFFLSALFANINSHWALVSFIVALLTIPYNIMMRYLLECRCCLCSKTLYTIGETLGGCVMATLALGSLIWIILGIIFAVQAGESFVSSWILGQVQSYVYQIFMAAAYVGYYMESTKEEFHKHCKDLFPNDPFEDLTNYGELADKVKWEHKEYKEGSKAQEAWDLVFLPWHESSGCYAASLEKYFS